MAGIGTKRTWMRLSTSLALILLGALPAEAVKRRAFVTSVSGNGNLGSWPDAGSASGLAAGNAVLAWTSGGGLAWQAHLGGFIAGWLYATALRLRRLA